MCRSFAFFFFPSIAFPICSSRSPPPLMGAPYAFEGHDRTSVLPPRSTPFLFDWVRTELFLPLSDFFLARTEGFSWLRPFVNIEEAHRDRRKFFAPPPLISNPPPTPPPLFFKRISPVRLPTLMKNYEFYPFDLLRALLLSSPLPPLWSFEIVTPLSL